MKYLLFLILLVSCTKENTTPIQTNTFTYVVSVNKVDAGEKLYISGGSTQSGVPFFNDSTLSNFTTSQTYTGHGTAGIRAAIRIPGTQIDKTPTSDTINVTIKLNGVIVGSGQSTQSSYLDAIVNYGY